MSTRIVHIIDREDAAWVVTETDPMRRTVNFQCEYPPYRGETEDGLYSLALPYVQMVIPIVRRVTAPWYSWEPFTLWVFGSHEPFGGTDQPVFALPMPNSLLSGRVYCAGTMKDWVRPESSREAVVNQVVTSYWTSSFTGWGDGPFPTGYGFVVFQSDASLRKIVPERRICNLFNPSLEARLRRVVAIPRKKLMQFRALFDVVVDGRNLSVLSAPFTGVHQSGYDFTWNPAEMEASRPLDALGMQLVDDKGYVLMRFPFSRMSLPPQGGRITTTPRLTLRDPSDLWGSAVSFGGRWVRLDSPCERIDVSQCATQDDLRRMA